MIRFTHQNLDTILADFLGKPYKRGRHGPDAFDCYGLVKAFMSKIGVEIADIGVVDPSDSRPIYEQQQTDYIRIPFPRPWSLVTFSGKDLNAHIGVVLPENNLFLHCPGRAAGKVIAEPLSRKPWRDSVDGYWWPKGYAEAVIMLTPMTTNKRAWQFIRTGRSLAEIVEKDITEGRNVDVQVFLDGELISKDNWINTIPTDLQQIVIRPVLGEGEQAAMMAGMFALALFAPYAAGAIVGKSTAAAVAAHTATAGQIFAYNLASASVMMAGGLTLSALVGSNESKKADSQHYTWDPQTTQNVGSFVPLVYGTYGVRGNILCAYASSEYTYETNVFSKQEQIRHASELYHMKIAYSDGPIDGIVTGTEKINDRDVDYYSDSTNFAVEHFTGTDDQDASSVLDAFEIPVGLECFTNEPVTTTFTAVDCDSVALVLRFPNGMADYAADGSHKPTTVTVKAEIRIAEGAWHTLMNGDLYGDSRDPMRINLNLAETYSGGSAFSITAGTTYEAKVTRTDNTHSDKGDSFLFDCVQFGYATAQKLPGVAYTAISSAASREISGSIQYYAKIKGKLVRVYDSNTTTWSIEWSDNPAWIAYDLLTRPVIKGNGDTVPYAVEYYKRLDPSYLILADFVTLADWCDELVSDGSDDSASLEKRYIFNGVFDQEGSAWDQCIRVCKMCCSMPYFNGNRIGIVIDKPGVPVQMFNISNMRSGFTETWIDTSEAATVYDVSFCNEQSDYATESYPVPLSGTELDIPVSMDGFGHTKRSQVWRRASRDLRINHYMKRTVEIPASLDAIYTSIGDIVYVQHPALNRSSGGRIVEVYADGIKVDKNVTMGVGTHGLLIRTHDGSDEHLTLYSVLDVTGAESGDSDIIMIDGVWEYTPNVNDVWSFGEETKVIDLYRVKGFERTGAGQVLIRGTQYTTDFYTEDEEAPIIQVQVYSTTKGGKSPTLLPTTAEAIKARLPDGNSTTYNIVWEGLVFYGESGDTGIVTWACEGIDGAGIKYQGVWVPIFDDAVGTTDKYIYFDPNVGDPRYLQHTNTLADLRGYDRYLMCINIDGVPYPKSALLIGADGKAIDADDVADGTSGLKEFHEYFQDPHGTIDARWINYSGGGELSIVSGGASGEYFLRVGDNSGDDQAWLIYDRSLAFDPSLIYRVQCRIRRTAGSGTCYLGLAGRNGADSAWVNVNGDSLIGSQHYITASGYSPSSDWIVLTGYVKGHGSTGDAIAKTDPERPGVMHTNVRWIRPLILVNYENEAGTFEIDEFHIDVMPPVIGSIRPTASDYNATGNGVTNDWYALQTYIDDCIASRRPFILPYGAAGIYRITDTLTVGDGSTSISGFTMISEGWQQAKFLYDGDPSKPVIEINGCNGLTFENIWVDGNNIAGVTGIYQHTGNDSGDDSTSQFTSLFNCGVVNCPENGYHILQTSRTCDYVSINNSYFSDNGVNIKVEGGSRQVDIHGGSNVNAATYGLLIVDGRVTGYDCFFGTNGYSSESGGSQIGSDIYLQGEIAQVQMFGGSSESLTILDGNWSADAGWSRLLSPNAFYNFNQASNDDVGGEVAIDIAMNYDCARPLILSGCKFMGDVILGDRVTSVQSVHTDFYNYYRQPADPNPITGFIRSSGIGVVNIIGRTDNSIGTGSITNTTILADRAMFVEDGWAAGVDIQDIDKTIWKRVGFSAGIPDTYYALKGWVFFNSNTEIGEPIGWRCVSSGNGGTGTVKASFVPFGDQVASFVVPVENLAPGSDITTRPIVAVNRGMVITSLSILCQGTPSGIDDSNTVVITLKDDSGNIVATKTYDTANQPPTNDYEDLSSLLDSDYTSLSAGYHLTLTVVQGATANMPAFLLTIGGYYV